MIDQIISLLIDKIKTIDYVCNNVEFVHQEDEFLYFDAVDLANCDLTIKVKQSDKIPYYDWEMYESYGDGWSQIK